MVAVRQAGTDVETRVVDHGCGVPAEQRERVFEEFFRGEGTRESSGTGLGLAIVDAVVRAHGGRVWCEETLGGGATFTFRLPMDAPRGAVQDRAVIRVLLVEDEPPLRRALRTALRAHGFRIAEVATGEDAVVVVAEGAVDLVVLDLGLPGIDGVLRTRERAFSRP